MPYKEAKAKKIYWTISEIAAELNINTSAIRFWEQGPFKEHIRPRRNNHGNRRYTAQMRATIHDIHRLLHFEGYTAKGAVRILDVGHGISRPCHAELVEASTQNRQSK